MFVYFLDHLAWQVPHLPHHCNGYAFIYAPLTKNSKPNLAKLT